MGIGVLVSGSGTILQAILDAGLPVAVVVADRPCAGLDRAERAGVANELVERADFSKAFDREGYTDRLVEVLRKYDVDLVVMSGFGTVVPRIVDEFGTRILNTHPSLLPAFPGWHSVRQALEHGVKVTGCTVIVVTAEMDAGPIVAQEAVPVLDGDTEASLHERIKEVERRLFPETIRRVIEGEIEL
ncbi:MAG TPA: phosphoribosylglycinamide formyltransferase [Acidimicrobiales bacterium]|nr:phosphoribosylglycinamide formyltransferase [Acidimicrobiales bacterium]